MLKDLMGLLRPGELAETTWMIEARELACRQRSFGWSIGEGGCGLLLVSEGQNPVDLHHLHNTQVVHRLHDQILAE